MKKIILFLIVITTIVNCGNRREVIPFVPVEIFVNIQNPTYQSLNGIGGWSYVEGGSRGIILYRLDQESFIAFDRHSPYNTGDPCGVVFVEENNISAVDTCSGSRFQLIDGSPIDGPATLGLQQYNTRFDGTNIIRIWN